MRTFGPVLVSAVVSNITMRQFAGYHAPFQMPAFPAVQAADLPWYLGLGLVCGLAAMPYLKLLDVSKRQFARLPLWLPFRLALGGLIVGVISLGWPEVWGNGYSVIESLLHTSWPVTALLALLVFKVLATAATTGSGAVGGVFTPTLFVGAAVGSLIGLAASSQGHLDTANASALAIVGMGAFMAACSHAPLMAVLLIFEMTSNYVAILPLALACVVAHSVASAISHHSLYEITALRNRRYAEHEGMRTSRIRELMKPVDITIGADATMAEMEALFRETPWRYLYVVDDQQRFLGAVALRDLMAALVDGRASAQTPASTFIDRDFVAVSPDDGVESVQQRFASFHGERLPVVDASQDGRLVGVVHKTTLLQLYATLSGADR